MGGGSSTATPEKQPKLQATAHPTVQTSAQKRNPAAPPSQQPASKPPPQTRNVLEADDGLDDDAVQYSKKMDLQPRPHPNAEVPIRSSSPPPPPVNDTTQSGPATARPKSSRIVLAPLAHTNLAKLPKLDEDLLHTTRKEPPTSRSKPCSPSMVHDSIDELIRDFDNHTTASLSLVDESNRSLSKTSPPQITSRDKKPGVPQLNLSEITEGHTHRPRPITQQQQKQLVERQRAIQLLQEEEERRRKRAELDRLIFQHEHFDNTKFRRANHPNRQAVDVVFKPTWELGKANPVVAGSPKPSHFEDDFDLERELAQLSRGHEDRCGTLDDKEEEFMNKILQDVKVVG